MLNNLDLYKLRLLSHLSDSESVKHTAQMLNVSPSAISQTVKLMEDQLGKQLFIRVGKKLKATPLAKEFCRRTRDYFSDLSNIMEGDIALGQELRVGAPPLFGTTLLANKVCQFARSNPKIKILVSIRDTHQLIRGLLDGEFDLAYIDETPTLKESPEIALTLHHTEELVLCCSREFHKQHGLGDRPSLKGLTLLPHIPYHKSKEAVFKWYQHHYGRQQDFSFSVAFDHPEGVFKAVVNHLGLGVLPLSYLEAENRLKKVVVVNGRKASLESRVYLAQLKGKVPSKCEKLLIEHTKF